MTGTDWMREVPIPEPPRRDAAPMVVFSASGGADALTLHPINSHDHYRTSLEKDTNS